MFDATVPFAGLNLNPGARTVEHIYSHVAPEVETRLIDALQHRWTTALHTLTTAAPGAEHGAERLTRLAPPAATPATDLTA